MKYLNLLFLLMTLSVITGCSDDTEKFIVPGTGDGISVNYRVEGEMALSRSVATTQHERTLEHVHVLFFDAENEAYQGYTRATVVAGKTTFSLDPPENLDLNKKYKVLAIGNGDDYLDGTYETMSAKLETLSGTLVDVKKQLTAIHSANITSKSVAALPLWGIFTDKDGGESSFTVTEEGGVRKVAEAENAEFLFSRAICRVDIHNLVGHLLDIRYARIANNRTAGYYFADGLNAGNVAEMNSAVTDPSTSDLYMPITADVTDEKTTQMLEASLYTFPNIVTTTAQNDKATTCLLIAGYYINPETGDKDDKLTFYRFNLANVGESQTLQRNYAYRATIKGVKRRGKDNEGDAYKDNIPIFEYNVDDEWDATDDNVVSDKDGNFLIVNKTHFTFNGEASEADFVELRVSTNPELTWTVEPVTNEDNENDNLENGKFIFKKISNNAVQVGPKEQNNTDYVRYGRYRIVATSPTIKAPLKMDIYMLQLSMKDNVKLLTVNGNTGTFTQEIPASGGTIHLRVVTGSNTNNWIAEDIDNELIHWDKDANWTKKGGNNNELIITAPANITKYDRTATIRVSLNPTDENVPPVFIELHQGRSDQWFSISPDPSAGVRINAFSTVAGYPNGVLPGTSRGFKVDLADTDYRFEVTTTFNEGRDLRLSIGSNLEGLSDQSTHNEYKAASHTGLTSGTTFYINPFRTGPGDPTIDGKVTVTVYNPDNPEVKKEQTFEVKIESGNDYLIYDVMFDNYLLADRNVGNDSRVKRNTDNSYDPEPNILGNFYDDENVKIYLGGADIPENTNTGNSDYKWLYDPYADQTSKQPQYSHLSGNRIECNSSDQVNAAIKKRWLEYHSDPNELFSPFYQEKYGWEIPLKGRWDQIQKLIRFTKWRMFIVSEVGEEIVGVPVVCWLPQTKGYESTDNNTTDRKEVFGGYIYYDGSYLYNTRIKNHDTFDTTKSLRQDMFGGVSGPVKEPGPQLSVRMICTLNSQADIEKYKEALRKYYELTKNK